MPERTITILPPLMGVDRRISPTGGRMPGSCYYCLNMIPRQHVKVSGTAQGNPANSLGLRVRPPITTIGRGAGNVIPTTGHAFFFNLQKTDGSFLYFGIWGTTLYNITSESAPSIPTSGSVGTTAAVIDGIAYFPMTASPHVRKLASAYTTVADLTATAGSLPQGTSLCCNYFGRLVLAGGGSTIYMSRINTPSDWDYTQTDALAAVALNTSLVVGGVQDLVMALMPAALDGLLIGGQRSLHYLRGNPAEGARMQVVSREMGVYRQNAFCSDASGYIYFISSGQRLMRFNPYTLAMEDLSGGRIGALDAWGMTYDPHNNGIWLFGQTTMCVLSEPESDSSFSDSASVLFYKIDSGDGVSGFFPIEGPTAMRGKYGGGNAILLGTSSLILFSTSGYTAVGYGQIDATKFTADLVDTEAIKCGFHSWPISPFKGNQATLVKTDINLQSIMNSQAKNQMSLKAFAGESESDVVLNARRSATLFTADASAGYVPGRQITVRKQLRGSSFMFRAANVSSSKGGFEVESIDATFEAGGEGKRR